MIYLKNFKSKLIIDIIYIHIYINYNISFKSYHVMNTVFITNAFEKTAPNQQYSS